MLPWIEEIPKLTGCKGDYGRGLLNVIIAHRRVVYAINVAGVQSLVVIKKPQKKQMGNA